MSSVHSTHAFITNVAIPIRLNDQSMNNSGYCPPIVTLADQIDGSCDSYNQTDTEWIINNYGKDSYD